MQRISISNLCNQEDDVNIDHDVEMAANALQNLRHSNGTPSANSLNEEMNQQNSEHFLGRVSNIPIVNSALRAYEQTKANSFVVKYGAETVESSVKTLCMPVINKLEPQLGQLDDFACRQLDRLEKHYSSFMEPIGNNGHYEQENGQGTSSSLHIRHPIEEGELRNRRVVELCSTGHNSSHYSQRVIQTNAEPPATRSRWQQVVLEAGVAAGAGVAVVSEESMRCLRYCQQWLSYSSAHIEQQIQLLRNYLSSLAGHSSSTAVATYTTTSHFLAGIKREVVATLRKVIDVVSRYAGSCLPGDARHNVRNFILNLPGRWASLNVPILESDSSTPCSSPLLTPNTSSRNSPTVLTPTEHAQRVLTLATESRTMLINIGDIFKNTVERAEGWLRAVGMNPTYDMSEEPLINGPLPHFALLPPPVPRSNSITSLSGPTSLASFSLNHNSGNGNNSDFGRNQNQTSSEMDTMC